ncbi:MAG: OmpA family protein [Gemmatimonadetes bacterium]|nr:OmpA family protein [Gemmatimonadota bacterium]
MLRHALIITMAAGLMLACSRRQEPTAQPVQDTPPTRTTTGPDTDSLEAVRRAAEAERLAAEATSRARAILEEMIFFDYDDSSIRTDQQARLNAKVGILRANPNVAMRVVGHADERGSLEYNLALGQRRANSVRDYLSGFGLDASRFATDSMGEDRPLDPGHDETAWSRNRRAEFSITRGGERMVTGDR